jgi:hypothetical protein
MWMGVNSGGFNVVAQTRRLMLACSTLGVLPVAYTGFRLRVTQGQLAGQWLTGLYVSQNGLPVQVLNWEEIVRRANQFTFNPTFHPDEKAAWGGFTIENAQTFQALVAHTGIQTEIVEPGQPEEPVSTQKV